VAVCGCVVVSLSCLQRVYHSCACFCLLLSVCVWPSLCPAACFVASIFTDSGRSLPCTVPSFSCVTLICGAVRPDMAALVLTGQRLAKSCLPGGWRNHCGYRYACYYRLLQPCFAALVAGIAVPAAVSWRIA